MQQQEQDLRTRCSPVCDVQCTVQPCRLSTYFAEDAVRLFTCEPCYSQHLHTAAPVSYIKSKAVLQLQLQIQCQLQCCTHVRTSQRLCLSCICLYSLTALLPLPAYSPAP
jgi:hypothetical protein